ncbi:MAG: F0F1 ATP synthase subunit B [Bacillota bacterium]|nr:F0F1 ATP synthase subunit B [Bacillota bacterium]
MELSIDWGRLILTIINFMILYFVLRHFLFKPVSNLITTRQNEIDSDIKNAEDNKVKAEQLRIESETNLRDSRDKGRSIVEDYKKKAESLFDEIKSDAGKEAQEVMERARKEAEREKEMAQAEVKEQIVSLAVLLSSRALEKSIDEEEHRRLINDFIAKVGI